VAAAFHEAHRQTYGYSFADRPEQQVEWVNLRVTGIGPIRRPQLRPDPRPAGGLPDPASTRPVCFDAGLVPTPIYWRPDLPPGATLSGPAIIEEYGSTVPLHPGFAATVDPYGNLLLSR
jgi:N-methylhydantoinase A